MEIQVNGATREMADTATVGDLLEILDLDLNGVAVAINRNVLPRSHVTSQALVGEMKSRSSGPWVADDPHPSPQ